MAAPWSIAADGKRFGVGMIAAYLRSRPVRANVVAVLLIVLLVSGLVFAARSWTSARVHRPAAVPSITKTQLSSVPTAPPPIVEPTVYAAITPDAARASNALVAIAKGKIAPARPFTFTGTPADRSTALTCLTAAVLYEAGDDPEGERAVAQVVLNRLRHPVFPKTVCGVIFQGADRKTGCQFTFACDGSIDRPPNPDAWKRAKAIADAALSGTVFKPVGTATHYHTDWVVPYWRDTLTKIAIVHTQIFYRWPGAWGLPPAFVGIAQAPEQLDPRLVALADPVPLSIDPATLSAAPGAIAAPGGGNAPGLLPGNPGEIAIDGVPKSALKGNIVRLKDEQHARYVLQLDRTAFPGSYAIVGYTICADKLDCEVLGWTLPSDLPRAFLPVPPSQMQGLAFLYEKHAARGAPQMQWNCRQMPRANPAECLPGTASTTPAPVGTPSH